MRASFFFGLVFLFGVGLLAPLSAQTIELEGITKEGDRVQQRSLVLNLPNAELANLARLALNLHGGIELRAAEPADFTVAITPTSPRAVSVTISSRGQVLATEVASAQTQEDALIAGLDYVLARLFGTPGWLGSEIAFVSDRTGHREIYHSDLLFRRARQMTTDANEAVLPALAPNGSQILYTSYHRTGFPDMFSLDLRTNERRTFAAFRGVNTGARFSPDGRRVALILTGSDNAEIFLTTPDGRNFNRLTTTRALEADPSWSPDGRRLALTSDALGKPQIYTIPVTGGVPRRVATNLSRHCAEPAWNPRDANLLAFTAAMAGEFEIALYDFTAAESTVLTRGRGDAIRAQWLADGRHLVYTERVGSRQRLMVLDTVTRRAVPLSPARFGNAAQADIAPPR